MKTNSLWVEKYRSKNLDDYVGDKQLKELIQKYIESSDPQNLLLHGAPGCGKTTLAKLIYNNIDCDSKYINASDERGIDTIREKVQGFAAAASFKPIKIIVLDEADYLTIQAQASLRNIIETYSRSTRFILTCNFIERIIDPIQSRCQIFKITPPSKKEAAIHVHNILNQENIQHELEDLGLIINQYYPDLRKIINTCQMLVAEDKTNGNFYLKTKTYEKLLINSNYQNKILDELKFPKKESWQNIRQILADSNTGEFEELYRYLYDNISEYSKGHEGEIAIILEEGLYHANFRVDKEINIMATISRILQIIKY